LRERDIEKYLVAQCKKRGIYCRKWVSVNSRGVPDRILLYEGNWYPVELKAPGKTLSKLQQVEHMIIRRHGGRPFTIDSKEGVDELIARII
jgi:hypothetical protein